MKVIVGLGNDKVNLQQTRHNAGFMIVERLAKKFICEGFSQQKKVMAKICKKSDYLFAKPTTFMNNSGQAVQAIQDYYQLESTENLYVIHDDLDLELGDYKIQFGTGPHDHNGLLSVYQHLGTKNFWHVRVGIDARSGSRLMETSNYVLQPFPKTELATFESTANKLVADLHKHVQMSH